MSEFVRIPYFAEWITPEHPHPRYAITHRRQPGRHHTLCGVHVFKSDGCAYETSVNEDENIDCTTCRAILQLSDA